MTAAWTDVVVTVALIVSALVTHYAFALIVHPSLLVLISTYTLEAMFTITVVDHAVKTVLSHTGIGHLAKLVYVFVRSGRTRRH